jgi:hypothetical protein
MRNDPCKVHIVTPTCASLDCVHSQPCAAHPDHKGLMGGDCYNPRLDLEYRSGYGGLVCISYHSHFDPNTRCDIPFEERPEARRRWEFAPRQIWVSPGVYRTMETKDEYPEK